MNRLLKLSALSLIPAFLIGCGGDDEVATYTVTITNTTHNQPMSPPAVVIYEGDTKAWNVGYAASHGLEVLAESGSPADFVSEAESASATATGDGIVGPGASTSIQLESTKTTSLTLTLATMLVNTNDAFTGVTAWNIGQLEVGESIKTLAPIYDAGTEFNDELAIYVPGPAGGGEGYSEGRETADQVTRHPGVVTQADGYAESALNESHKFDNGAILIVVERTE